MSSQRCWPWGAEAAAATAPTALPSRHGSCGTRSARGLLSACVTGLLKMQQGMQPCHRVLSVHLHWSLLRSVGLRPAELKLARASRGHEHTSQVCSKRGGSSVAPPSLHTQVAGLQFSHQLLRRIAPATAQSRGDGWLPAGGNLLAAAASGAAAAGHESLPIDPSPRLRSPQLSHAHPAAPANRGVPSPSRVDPHFAPLVPPPPPVLAGEPGPLQPADDSALRSRPPSSSKP